MGKVIGFNPNKEEPEGRKEQLPKEPDNFPPFLKELRDFILSYYPNTISDILGFNGFLKNDSPYVFVGYVVWEDKRGARAITPLIAMFRNVDKRFAFLNAKNHYFDPQVLKSDVESLGINIDAIFKALDNHER